MIPEPDAALVRDLARDLRAARFTSENLRATWGVVADDAIGRGARMPALRAIESNTTPAATLGRLLILGIPQPIEAVSHALPHTLAAGLAALGIVRIDGDQAIPAAVIRPQSFIDDQGADEWWVASDLDELALGGPISDDHVLGVGGASLTLAGLVIPTPAERVLDLGTGCGIQALRALRFSSDVVATDVSEAALRFTRFNALLNDTTAIHTRSGSLFEPVEGEAFDRVISNPPFVITPRTDGVPLYDYRDGGMQGDDLVAAFVRGVGAHLAPGGIAQLLGNWEYTDSADGLDRVREWVDSAEDPLDAWIIEREQLDPVAYAQMWIRDGGTQEGTVEYDDLLDAWLADFDERGVTKVGFGYILLRKPFGRPTLSRYERVTQTITAEGALGSSLGRSLAAHDEIASLDDDSFAQRALIVAPDVTEARHHIPGEADPSVIELHQGSGFGRVVQVDPAVAGIVGASDGELSVGQLISAVADIMEVDHQALRAQTLPILRELVTDGFLTVARADGGQRNAR